MRKTLMRKKKAGSFGRIFPAAVYTLTIAVLLGLLFDYYFDLNDDVLIKDILAGVQTGTPSGYSIQMLYPVSVLISLLYRLTGRMDWFGLFLCACQYGCLFLIALRSLELYDGRGKSSVYGKTAVLAFQGVVITGLFLREFIFVQYTVTCGLLTGAAVFLLYTAPDAADWKAYVKENAVGIVMLLTAFCIRTEMFLLLLPFLGAAGLARWLKAGFRAQWKKYGAVIGILAAGMAACYAVDLAAYSSPQWKEFCRVFDARTQIYDFYGIPDYKEHQAFYASVGMGEAEYEMLQNYNYGADETLNADRLERIEAYAKAVYQKEHSVAGQVKKAVWEYRQRLLLQKDTPYTGIVLFGYVCVCMGMIAAGRKRYLWEPALLFAARSVSWLYLLYRNRVVDRITQPLYWMEIVILAAVFLKESEYFKRRVIISAAAFLLAAWGILLLPQAVLRVSQEQAYRRQVNVPYEALREYCKQNAEHYYYVDVYSTVRFSEKMFEKVDNSKRNYDIIGGWACKSPLSGTEPLRYLVTDSGYDAAWLENYYRQNHMPYTVEKRSRFGTKDAKAWEVYEIKKN